MQGFLGIALKQYYHTHNNIILITINSVVINDNVFNEDGLSCHLLLENTVYIHVHCVLIFITLLSY